MKFVIGSNSKRKIDTAERVIKQLFADSEIVVEGYKSVSGVPETPYDKETFNGAKNRAVDAKANIANGDMYIGVESGLVERYGYMYEEAWAVVLHDGKEYCGYSSGLKVPDYILAKMDELKMPHSEVMGLIEEEYKKTPNDTWGTYSGGAILREISLEEALRNALVQVISTEDSFYKK